MSFIVARTRHFVVRCTTNLASTSIPWKYSQCSYATKRKNLSNIIRWNTENKALFGSKQKVTKKTASVKDSTKVTRKSAKGTSTRKGSTVSKQHEQRLEDMKMVTSSGVSDSADYSEADEWQYEGKVLMEKNESDIFHAQNEHYNQLLDSGEGYEGSDISSSSLEYRGTNRYDIPEISPVPRNRNTFETAPRVRQSAVKKSTAVNNSTAAPDFQGADFICQCPLLPSQFEDMFNSAQEFRSFVESLGLRVLPTVNTVLNKTRPDLSNFFLQRWREKMIQELGEAGFKKHQEATIWQGTNLHACIQQFLSGVPLADIQVQNNIQGHWDSISTVLPDVTDIQALETNVSHPWLCYKGTFDCIARYKNVVYLIDWKTSSKPKPLLSNLYDNPLQVAAYLGAVNLSVDFTDKFGVMEQAAIIVAYANGEAAHIHRLKPALCQHYWKEWRLRLHQYWTAVAAEKMA